MISTNYVNTFQYADQISWNHGKHTIRAAFELERIQYNNTIQASIRGELLIGLFHGRLPDEQCRHGGGRSHRSRFQRRHSRDTKLGIITGLRVEGPL